MGLFGIGWRQLIRRPHKAEGHDFEGSHPGEERGGRQSPESFRRFWQGSIRGLEAGRAADLPLLQWDEK